MSGLMIAILISSFLWVPLAWAVLKVLKGGR